MILPATAIVGTAQHREAIRLQVTAAALAYAQRLSHKIADGYPTTWQYCEFCRAHGYNVVDGVFLHGAPRPLPFREPMQCLSCGHVAEQRTIETDERFSKRTLQATTYYEPDEFVTICRVCEAVDPFEVAIKCAECGERPCLCD